MCSGFERRINELSSYFKRGVRVNTFRGQMSRKALGYGKSSATKRAALGERELLLVVYF